MDPSHFLSQTKHNATISDADRLTVTHPYLSFYGKEYLLVDQYIRCNELILRCIEEEENKIITIPAVFTDYYEIQTGLTNSDSKTYFTIQGLTQVASIIGHVVGMST